MNQSQIPSVEHTAGPWRVEDTGMVDSLAIMARDRPGAPNEYRWIATASTDEERGVLYQEMEANARLIAAAPAMVAALKWFVDLCDEGKAPPPPIAYAFFKGVITAAEGRQP